MKNIINILLLTLCLLVGCCAKTPTNSVNTEKTLNEQYPFAIEQSDSVVIKVCRFEHKHEHDSLMARYLFDYFYELTWEETGVAEVAHYKNDEKDSILSIIEKAPTQGLTPEIFRGKEYKSYLQTETPVDDQNIIAKIEIFNREHRLINVLWCSRYFIDGMEEFNFPLRKEMPKELLAEFEKIHKRTNLLGGDPSEFIISSRLNRLSRLENQIHQINLSEL